MKTAMSGSTALDQPRHDVLLTPDLPMVDGALFALPDTKRPRPTTPSPALRRMGK